MLNNKVSFFVSLAIIGLEGVVTLLDAIPGNQGEAVIRRAIDVLRVIQAGGTTK